MNAQSTGTPQSGAATPGKGAARSTVARQANLGQSFAQIVAVLMRDAHYKNLKIADLEPLVMPPLMAGQFKLAHGTRHVDAAKEKQAALAFPVGVALWARVSAQADKALSESLDKQVWLRPAEWTSGDIVWLMAVAGYPRTLPEFMKQLAATEFKGQQVKMRVTGPDGKVSVQLLK